MLLKSNKILTIFILLYNGDKYMDNCLSYLIKSKYFENLDIVLFNDGSTDNSESICNSYTKKYPQSIRLINKQNGNVGSIYNLVKDVAEGKYIKELDVDDHFDTTGLDSLIELLSKTDVDVVFTKYNTVNENGELRYPVSPIKSKEIEVDKIYHFSDFEKKSDYISLSMHAITYSTDLIRKNTKLYDERTFYTDNEWCCFNILNADAFVYHNVVVYNYSLGIDEQSSSRKNLINNINQLKQVVYSCIEVYLAREDYDKRIIIYSYIVGIVAYVIRICLYMEQKESITNIKDFLDRIYNHYPAFYNMINNRTFGIKRKNIEFALSLKKLNYKHYNLLLFVMKIKKKLKKIINKI